MLEQGHHLDRMRYFVLIRSQQDEHVVEEDNEDEDDEDKFATMHYIY